MLVLLLQPIQPWPVDATTMGCRPVPDLDKDNDRDLMFYTVLAKSQREFTQTLPSLYQEFFGFFCPNKCSVNLTTLMDFQLFFNHTANHGHLSFQWMYVMLRRDTSSLGDAESTHQAPTAVNDVRMFFMTILCLGLVKSWQLLLWKEVWEVSLDADVRMPDGWCVFMSHQ